MLKFTDVCKDQMERAEIEGFIISYVDTAFKPTQKRVLEVQEKMATISREQVEIKGKVGAYKGEMDEALGTGGKGPLKD